MSRNVPLKVKSAEFQPWAKHHILWKNRDPVVSIVSEALGPLGTLLITAAVLGPPSNLSRFGYPL